MTRVPGDQRETRDLVLRLLRLFVRPLGPGSPPDQVGGRPGHEAPQLSRVRVPTSSAAPAR